MINVDRGFSVIPLITSSGLFLVKHLLSVRPFEVLNFVMNGDVELLEWSELNKLWECIIFGYINCFRYGSYLSLLLLSYRILTIYRHC